MNVCATCGKQGDDNDSDGIVDLANRWFCLKHRMIRRAALAIWNYLDKVNPVPRKSRQFKPVILTEIMIQIERHIEF